MANPVVPRASGLDVRGGEDVSPLWATAGLISNMSLDLVDQQSLLLAQLVSYPSLVMQLTLRNWILNLREEMQVVL